MSDTLIIGGTTYNNVAGFKATDSGGNTLTFVRPTGTDFTAEWQRPSAWPTLPNDIGTYAGQYFLYKKETGKTVYKLRLDPNVSVEVGTTDASGNFTSLLTVTRSDTFTGTEEIDISNLQLDEYFWVRGRHMALSITSYADVMFEPVVESIISNCNVSFGENYSGAFGAAFNACTIHFLANKWLCGNERNFNNGNNKKSVLQCVEFYGGTNTGALVLPVNCNTIIIDNVGFNLSANGTVYGPDGRGSSQHGYATYANVTLPSNCTSFRIPLCGGSTEEAQAILNKVGDLSGITNLTSFLSGAYKVARIDLTGKNLTNVTMASNMFSSCFSLREIIWGETDFSGTTTISSMFYGASSITSISIPGTLRLTSSMYYAFQDCYALETLDLSNISFSSGTYFSMSFSGCYSLKNLTFKADAGIAQNIDLSDSEQLTVASLLSLFNALATVTTAKTCTIGATNLAKLSAAEKAIATNKGWTLA